MRIYVKRGNWDGGIWFELPATDAEAGKLWEELADIHPMAMIPYIGDVDCGIRGMGECLIGEPVFEKDHLEMLGSLAKQLDEMGAEECLLYAAAMEMERPKSIGQALETMGHLDAYGLKPEIRDMDGLGRYIAQKEGDEIPQALEELFDYGSYASVRQDQYGCFTKGGFVERRKPQEATRTGLEADVLSQKHKGREGVFTVEVKKQPWGQESFSLPMAERELAEAEKRIGTAEYGYGREMRVLAVHDELFETLPPGSTIRELNQAAEEIRTFMEQGEPDWKLLLAALEAELPESMESACRIIRNCGEYRFLPLESLTPENYAWYILEKDGVRIPPHLQTYVRAGEFGRRMMEETGPVQTLYGVIVNRVRPIQPPAGGAGSFRLFSPLTISVYGGPEPLQPVIASGQEAVSMQADIRKHIALSLKGYGDSGLAELLSNRMLARKVRCMRPDVEEKYGELWGVLQVDTEAALTDREKAALEEEWRKIAGEGWGMQLMCMPVRRGAREVYVGFWDTERGSGLFISAEEEFLRNTGRHGIKLQ